MSTVLSVALNGIHAADVDLRGGRASLKYRSEYVRSSSVPLSARFPLSRREIKGAEVRRWLLNLLPDDDNVLNYLRSEHGASGRDPLRLLGTAMGFDCAGAVQFCLPDRMDEMLSRGGGIMPVAPEEIAAWLNAYPVLPSVIDPTGEEFPVTFSLAGMQPKIALRRTGDGSWARTWGSLPTTHIFKAARAEYPDECVFEHLTMSAAGRLGIPAARTEAVDIDGTQAIIVERFDRTDDGRARIHQEDSCQALGKPQSEKYESLGGPGAAALRQIAQSSGAAASRNVDRLRDMLIYRWLVVDSDAHAKNYSWLFDDAGQVHLAPLYDSCSWLPYRRGMRVGDISLAMRMGSSARIGSCDTPEALMSLADKLRRPRPEVCERAAELAAALPAAVRGAAEALPPIPFDWGRVDEHVAELDVRASECERVAMKASESPAARTAGKPADSGDA